MTEKEDIFDKAVESLRGEPVPPGPPRELIDATMAKLAEHWGSPAVGDTGNYVSQRGWPKVMRSFGRVAAAAVVLIAAGYAVGRWSAPRPPDLEQIRAAIEPAIRQELLDETRQYVQLSLANGYLQVKDELSEQCRQDLSRVAIQTLAASNATTNDLLAQFIEFINAAQIKDRQRVAAALEQIELNRLRDRNQLSSAFATFAVQTEDELMQTKKDVAHVLSYALPDGAAPYEFKNSDNSDERNKP
jgi:hypothetical protein